MADGHGIDYDINIKANYSDVKKAAEAMNSEFKQTNDRITKVEKGITDIGKKLSNITQSANAVGGSLSAASGSMENMVKQGIRLGKSLEDQLRSHRARELVVQAEASRQQRIANNQLAATRKEQQLRDAYQKRIEAQQKREAELNEIIANRKQKATLRAERSTLATETRLQTQRDNAMKAYEAAVNARNDRIALSNARLTDESKKQADLLLKQYVKAKREAAEMMKNTMAASDFRSLESKYTTVTRAQALNAEKMKNRAQDVLQSQAGQARLSRGWTKSQIIAADKEWSKLNAKADEYAKTLAAISNLLNQTKYGGQIAPDTEAIAKGLADAQKLDKNADVLWERYEDILNNGLSQADSAVAKERTRQEEAKLQAAKDRLDEAEKALEDHRNGVLSGDVQSVDDIQAQINAVDTGHYISELEKVRAEIKRLQDDEEEYIQKQMDVFKSTQVEMTAGDAARYARAGEIENEFMHNEKQAGKALEKIPEEFKPAADIVKDVNSHFETMETHAKNVGKALVKGIDLAQQAVYGLMNTMSSPRIMQRTAANMQMYMRQSLGDEASQLIDIAQQIEEDKRENATEAEKKRNEILDEGAKLTKRTAQVEHLRNKENMDEALKVYEAEKKVQDVRTAAANTEVKSTGNADTKLQSQLSVGQKLKHVWDSIAVARNKANEDRGLRRIEASLMQQTRHVDNRAKSLLRVLLLSDKERKNEDQILAEKRKIVHYQNQINNLMGKTTGPNGEAQASKDMLRYLAKREQMEERIRRIKNSMYVMEDPKSGKQTDAMREVMSQLRYAENLLTIAQERAAESKRDTFKESDEFRTEQAEKLDEQIAKKRDELAELSKQVVYHDDGTATLAEGINGELSTVLGAIGNVKGELDSLTRQKEELFSTETLDAELDAAQERVDTLKRLKDELVQSGGAYEDRTESRRYEVLQDDLKHAEDELVKLDETYASTNGVPAPSEAEISKWKEWSAQITMSRNKLQELQFERIRDGIVSVGKKLKSVFSKFKSVFGTLSSGFKKLASWISRAAKALNPFSSSKHASKTNAFSGAVNKLTSRFTRLWGMLMTRFKRRLISAVFNDIKGVFTEIANINPQFNEAVSGVVNSARRLGAQILAILEPVIVRLAPLVEKLADVLAGVADKVAQFSANVFGFDLYTKAEKGNYDFAESMDEAANSASNATKKTKEYENTVLGFDQLNKLNGDNSSSDTTSAQLEQLETQSNAWNDIAKSIWDAYKQGDWENMGKNMATGLNYLFAHLGATFGWDLNSEKIKEKLKNFTTVLNSFVKNIDAKQIGFAIGDIANTLINSLDYLLNDPDGKIDFSTLGEKIGQLLGSALTKINWTNVGRVLVGALRAFGDVLRGALTTTIKDAEGNDITLGTALGNALRDMLKGAVELFDPDHLSDVIAAIVDAFNDFIIALTSDPELFGTLGTKLAESVNLMVEKIDQGKMTTAFKQLSTSIGKLLGNFFGGVDWGDLGEMIGNALGVDSGNLLMTGILGALLGKKLGIGGIGGALAALFLTGSTFGGDSGILSGIGNAIATVSDLLTQILGIVTKIGEIFSRNNEGEAGVDYNTARSGAELALMVSGHPLAALATHIQGEMTEDLADDWLLLQGKTIWDEWGGYEAYQNITGHKWWSSGKELLDNAQIGADGTLSLKEGHIAYIPKDEWDKLTKEQQQSIRNTLDPNQERSGNHMYYEQYQAGKSLVALASRNTEEEQRLQQICTDLKMSAEDFRLSFTDFLAKYDTVNGLVREGGDSEGRLLELHNKQYTDGLTIDEQAELKNLLATQAVNYSNAGDGFVTDETITNQANDVKSIRDAVVTKPENEEETSEVAKMVEANTSLIEAIKNGDKELVVKIGETTIQRAFLTVLGQFSKQYGQSL